MIFASVAGGIAFEQSLDRLIKEADANPEQAAKLRATAEQMSAVSGIWSPAWAADALAGLLEGSRMQREREEFWARQFPDVAALGDDSPHVSVRNQPYGGIIWSWMSKGQRRWQRGEAML